MKKLLLAFLLIVPMASAFADDGTPDPCANGSCFASSTYVTGAFNTLDSAKQATLQDDTTVLSSGTGAVVTGVTATSGIVTVTRSDITIPNIASGQSTPSAYSAVWVE